MEEVWKPVVGYDGVYEVSDHGRVRRILKARGTRTGILQPSTRTPYAHFTLSYANKTKQFYGHHLVYTAFVGPIPPGMDINHENGKKHDNRLSNLTCVTRGQNLEHRYRVLGHPGVSNAGEKAGRAKLKNADVPEILRLYRECGLSQVKIAAMYGVHDGTISRIIRGAGWQNVERDKARATRAGTLSWEQICAIREGYAADSGNMQEIADHYGTTRQTIWRIIRGKVRTEA